MSDVISVDVVIKRSRRHAVIAGIGSASIVPLITLTHRATVEAVFALGAESCFAIHVSGKVRIKGGSNASAVHTYVLHVLQTYVHVARTSSIRWGVEWEYIQTRGVGLLPPLPSLRYG